MSYELPVTTMTAVEIRALPEYSCSIPTGVVAGKRWKRHEPYLRSCANNDPACGHWLLGAYIALDDDIRIQWSKLELLRPPRAVQKQQEWSPETD